VIARQLHHCHVIVQGKAGASPSGVEGST
jgi:hypothetical protein